MALRYRVDFLHYELVALGREPRWYTDARKAGGALASARPEEMPQVLLHEADVTISRRGEEPYAFRTLVAFTARGGPPYRHVMLDHDLNLDRAAAFRDGYEEMRQRLRRSDVRAVSVEQWMAGPDPPRAAPQEGPDVPLRRIPPPARPSDIKRLNAQPDRRSAWSSRPTRSRKPPGAIRASNAPPSPGSAGTKA